MTEYRLVAEPRADLDVAAAFHWYEGEEPGLGLEFLDQLSAAYDRIVADPLKYQNLESDVAVPHSTWSLRSEGEFVACTTAPQSSNCARGIPLCLNDRQKRADRELAVIRNREP